MIIQFARADKRVHDFVDPSAFFDGSAVQELDLQIYGNVSITEPVFVCGMDTFNSWLDYREFEYNYAHISHWMRYYYISDVAYEGDLVYLYFAEDYLASGYSRVKDQTFYCIRSESDYDESITDTYYPAKVETSATNRAALSPWESVMNGSYILAINSGGSDHAHIGTNCYYVLSQSEMTQFLSDLMGTADLDFAGIGESIAKAIVNPMQYIRSCIWLPVIVDASMQTVDSIDFGWWSSSASAKVLEITKNSDTYTQITVNFLDCPGLFADDKYAYLSYPPYSSLMLTAYPFGVIELPRAILSNIKGGANLRAVITIDHITGMGELILYTYTDELLTGPYYVTTAQVGVDIPVGDVVQDFAGAVMSLGQTVGNALSGNFLGAAQGVYNAISDVAPNVTTTGADGGFGLLQLDETWMLRRYSYAQAEPALDLAGLPCCAEKKISDLSGFAQFSGVDVGGVLKLGEKQEIARLLEEGIYIL